MDGRTGQLGAAANDASQLATDRTIYCANTQKHWVTNSTVNYHIPQCIA